MNNLKTSFRCLIPDKLIGAREEFFVGLTTGGAFRSIFRKAFTSFSENEITITTFASDTAGGGEIIVAKILIKDIAGIRISPIPISEQVKVAAIKALILGGGTVLIILLISLFNENGINVDIGIILLCVLAFGLIFSFIPSLLKFKRDLSQILIVNQDKTIQAIAVVKSEMNKALELFSGAEIKTLDKLPK